MNSINILNRPINENKINNDITLNRNINEEKDEKKEVDFLFYPELTDIDFNKIIFMKKEFRDNLVPKIQKKVDELCVPKEFELEPYQNFLKNYISPDTPYNGILIVHGTGVGKTCSAISIAENFKKTLKHINKKVLIISTLQKNFEKELFDFTKELKKKTPDEIVQCSGREYELIGDVRGLTSDQKKREVMKAIRSYYQFMGYQELANYLSKKVKWSGDEKDIDPLIIKYINKEFSNRVIIIDEVHNIKTGVGDEYKKTIQPMIRAIIKYSKNIKLIMMSATPMFDRSDEIIFLLNLLLLNDKRQEVKISDFFTKNGKLIESNKEKFKQLFKGYISFVRAENPITFPLRIYPVNSIIPNIKYDMLGNKLNEDDTLKYSKIVTCKMTDIQELTYNYYLNKHLIIKRDEINNTSTDVKENTGISEIDEENKLENDKLENDKLNKLNLLLDLVYISIIVYPVKDISNDARKISMYGTYGKHGINNDTDNAEGGLYKDVKYSTLKSTINKKKTYVYKYQSHAIFDKGTKDEAPFLDEKHLFKYSTKFASILKSIKEAKGLVFIYSRFVDIGVIPFAIMLEQNGFLRHKIKGENDILEYSANKLKGGGKRDLICYYCGHSANWIEHIDNNNANYHIFKVAKFILVHGISTGDELVKIKKEHALSLFTNTNNMYGEEIKIFIGSKTTSEGLDFSRIRQMHIIEPWYNLSRNEQTIGRAIRRCSHILLPPDERNVEVYQYASIISDDTPSLQETIDLKYYRIAELKDYDIKQVMRIMKCAAVDCNFMKNINVYPSSSYITQKRPNGDLVEILYGDVPYSAMCDYNELCEYKCDWEPTKEDNIINIDTYNIHFASMEVEKCKRIIKDIYKYNYVYDLYTIELLVKKEYYNISDLFIYEALDYLVNNKNEIIYDKFSRIGYLIYRGNLYIYQPIDIEREDIPYIYRILPTSITNKTILLMDIVTPYNYIYDDKNNNNNNSSYTININKLIHITNNNINNIIEIHDKLIIKKYVNEYIISCIGIILSKLNYNELFIYISNILLQFISSEHNNKLFINIIKYLKYNIIHTNKTSVLSIIGFKLNKISVSNTTNIIYFYYNKALHVFTEATQEQELLLKKYELLQTEQVVNKNTYIISGTISVNNKGGMFKVVDKSLKSVNRKSKRGTIKGRGCLTYEIKQLMDIRNKLKMYNIEGKRRDFLCNDIELYLRYMQELSNMSYKDLSHINKFQWFIDRIY